MRIRHKETNDPYDFCKQCMENAQFRADMEDKMEYRIKFIPEAWINDYAVRVDPEGPAEWTISDAEYRRVCEFTGVEEIEDYTYEADELRNTVGAPAWVGEWRGPFEVTVEPVENGEVTGLDVAEICARAEAETAANARLIAAAPALLAALSSVIDQLDGIGVPDWHGAEGLYLDAARAALAKARGE